MLFSATASHRTVLSPHAHICNPLSGFWLPHLALRHHPLWHHRNRPSFLPLKRTLPSFTHTVAPITFRTYLVHLAVYLEAPETLSSHRARVRAHSACRTSAAEG